MTGSRSARRISVAAGVAAAIALSPLAAGCSSGNNKSPTTSTVTTTVTTPVTVTTTAPAATTTAGPGGGGGPIVGPGGATTAGPGGSGDPARAVAATRGRGPHFTLATLVTTRRPMRNPLSRTNNATSAAPAISSTTTKQTVADQPPTPYRTPPNAPATEPPR